MTQPSTLKHAIDLTIEGLKYYGSQWKHWAIAYSGGKDSSATVAVIGHAIATGAIAPPESVTVIYADTRMELPPLHAAAMQLLKQVEEKFKFRIHIIVPKIDDRFFVYMLGRGVAPPKQGFRWCTRKMKVKSMQVLYDAVYAETGEQLLGIDGIRIGESAERDKLIVASCSKDGGECGQGWYHNSNHRCLGAKYSPILHWRVCHVWDFLLEMAYEYNLPTGEVAEVYGMNVRDGEEPLNARTGCIGCPLVSGQDKALLRIVKNPKWSYLEPCLQLNPFYDELLKPEYRHRWDSSIKGNMRRHGQLGPLTLETREWALEKILSIQAETNRLAIASGMPLLELINEEELARIREQIAAKTYPNHWTGEEILGTEYLEEMTKDGWVQGDLYQAMR